jgi:hypothetical protein
VSSGLWHGLRAWPWDETQVPKPRTPHPEPTMPATVGDWLTEFGTALLHYKAGAKTDGSGAWRFEIGYRWDLCTEIDCAHDRNHLTADLLREVGAEEIKALLSEGTT